MIMVWHYMVWYGMVWYGMVWYGISMMIWHTTTSEVLLHALANNRVASQAFQEVSSQAKKDKRELTRFAKTRLL